MQTQYSAISDCSNHRISSFFPSHNESKPLLFVLVSCNYFSLVGSLVSSEESERKWLLLHFIALRWVIYSRRLVVINFSHSE